MQIYTIISICLLLILVRQHVECGLLKVPKIYNAVITSDANLEPSRTYPIVQPVLSVGVQPVYAAAAAIPAVTASGNHQQHHHRDQPAVEPVGLQPIAGYFPYALGGFYPVFAGGNALYPTVYYAQQQQPSYASGENNVPQQSQVHQEPQQLPQSNPKQTFDKFRGDIPETEDEPDRYAASAPVHVPDSSHHHADPFNNHHRLKNPEIPDVPPPPLPVKVPKNSSS